MDYTTGIATSKIFHLDIALWRNTIAEGYYELEIDKMVLFLAWLLVISSAVYNLIRMAAGSPKGAKQLILVGASALLLGFTKEVRGTSVDDPGLLWRFYHGVYSALYGGVDCQLDNETGKSNCTKRSGALSKLAGAGSTNKVMKYQVEALKTLGRLKAEVSLARNTVGTLLEALNSWTGRTVITAIGTVGAALTGAATKNPRAAATVAGAALALQTLAKLLDDFIKKLDKGLSDAVMQIVNVTIALMQENAAIIYATTAIVVFISLFWPLLVSFLALPGMSGAFMAAIALIPGSILAMVISGVLLLAALLAVFNTSANALTEYNNTIQDSLVGVEKAQKALETALDSARMMLEANNKILDTGEQILGAQKSQLEILKGQSPEEEPKAVLTPVICKLKITNTNNDPNPNLAFWVLEEDPAAGCIGQGTSLIGAVRRQEGGEVTLAEVEEYLVHYRETRKSYNDTVNAQIERGTSEPLSFLEARLNGLLGMLIRLGIQLRIVQIAGIVIGVATLIFTIFTASLGTKMGVGFIRGRLGL